MPFFLGRIVDAMFTRVNLKCAYPAWIGPSGPPSNTDSRHGLDSHRQIVIHWCSVLVTHTCLPPVHSTGVVPRGGHAVLAQSIGVGGLTGTAAAGPLTAKSR